MAKATRKHATHHKKARAHHAVKAHAQRSNAPKTSAGAKPIVLQPDAEIIDEEFASRSETRIGDDSDDEVGIYGPGRGETAG